MADAAATTREHGAWAAPLDGIIDYAGLFPPSALDDDAAVAEFGGHRRTADLAHLMRRFVLPLGQPGRARALAEGLRRVWKDEGSASPHVRVAGLLPAPALAASAPTGAVLAEKQIREAIDQALASLGICQEFLGNPASGDDVMLDTLEWSLPLSELDDAAWAPWELPLREAVLRLGERVELSQVTLFVECGWRDADFGRMRRRFEALVTDSSCAGSGSGVKIRTGGLQASLVPSSPVLAAMMAALLQKDRPLPFKCTAGLHAALRETSPRFGFVMHGFVNVLAAAGSLLLGADQHAASALLEEQSRHGLEDRVIALTGMTLPAVATRARTVFKSFGSCSVREPLESLVAHGFVATR